MVGTSPSGLATHWRPQRRRLRRRWARRYPGAMVAAFVLIRAEPVRISGLADELTEVDGVAEVYSVAGDEDLVAIVRVAHHDDLAEVVTERINVLDGIVATRTMIAFKAYSRHDLESMWSLGAE